MPKPTTELARKVYLSWERSTARLLDVVLRSSIVLDPAAAAIGAATRVKRGVDRSVRGGWRALGLPTKAEQDRILHALNEVQSKLLDLEEELADRRGPKP